MTINERVSPERLDTISAEYSRPNHTKNFSATDWEIAAMARELQQYRAAAEKPIGSFHIIDQQVDGTTDYVKDGEWPIDNGELLVYAAPQGTSVPEEATPESIEVLASIRPPHGVAFQLDGYERKLASDIWNACRGAMLTGEGETAAPAVQAEQEPIYQLRDVDWYDTDKRTYDTVVNTGGAGRIVYAAPQLPQPAVVETLPCPVMLEPGLRFGKGVRTQTMLDALQRRAEYYDELEAMTPEQRADHDAGIKEFAAMLQGAESPSGIQPAPSLDLLPKSDEVPTTIKPVADLYSIAVPGGRSTTYSTDAAEASDCRAMGWAVQEYVKLERYQEAMLQGAESSESRCSSNQGAEHVNQPTLPDGCCIMPMKLTAENGAKGALSGEFSETKFINCPECLGDDECETCDGSGRIEITVPVSWTTIKEIWAKGVEHFAAAPKQEAEP